MEVLAIAGVKIEHVSKSYTVSGNRLQILDDINLTIDEGSITVMIGKSGCGKTTFLKLLHGLEQPDNGNIFIPKDSKLGMVFQEDRLMPWLNTWDNITFSLKKKEINKSMVENTISLVGLKGFERAYPSQLSGGMRQRASLARALLYNPSLLLMDEPFASLDFFTRENLQNEIIRIHETNGIGIVFVTHNIDEALKLGQRIIVLEAGKVKVDYDLSGFTYVRDVLSPPLIETKKDILNIMKEDSRKEDTI
jgi:sulfonate transport system ATP-binding protein